MIDRSHQVVKGYELHEQVGKGGFGVVYRAYQPLLKRPVAIKVILPEYANQPDFIRRFEVEAELVARLEHPHIIPLYDYWREPDGAYLVMRWLGGGSLRDALDETGAWEPAAAARLVDEITAALTVAHRHGVIHRDIKPDNILLDEDGNTYLADFGIAKDLATPDSESGEVTGSPAYFAPEQIRGENVTPRTDLYSLGVTLYEVLTGSRPFPQATVSEMIIKHLNDPLPSLTQYRRGLPPALDDVLQRVTAKDPDARYKNALELAAAFHHALAVTPDTPVHVDDTETITDFLSNLVSERHDLATVGPPPTNPYKGLHSFQESDSADFFGRDRLIGRLIERLAEAGDAGRFLAVVGPSGSGKSSVVKAGLMPRLRQGALPHSTEWFVAQMVPGAHPLEELEIALLRIAVNPPESLLAQLREDERGLLRAVRRILPDDGSELVLVIDQFEEVFTQVEDATERTHFLGSLYAAATDARSQLRVIVTLRADFYDRPLQYRDFGELLRTHMESVLPLSAEELYEAIVSPAERVGVALEPELVSAIVEDVGEQPGTLPLLQYALTELFERQQSRLLTLATYQEIGGIAGALAGRAEELYLAMSGESEEAVRQLFLRLVTLGEGSEDTRRRVRRSELVGAASGGTLDTVIDAYGRYRLLTFDRDPITRGPTVEIAHEALLRVWTRLRNWIDDSREEVRIQRRVTLAAREWVEAGKDPGFLASGGRLAQFEAWAAETKLSLNEEEAGFLEQSLSEREAQRTLEEARQAREAELARDAAQRLRWLVAALAVFLIVALGLTAFALDREQQSQTQAGIAAQNAATATYAQGHAEQQAALAQTQAIIADRSARQAQGIALAANSQLILNSDDTDLGLLVALEADRIAEEPAIETLRALTAAAYAPGTRFRLSGHEVPILSVAFSPDGKWALSASGDEASLSHDGELILWDLTTGTLARRFEGHANKVVGVAFDPGGQIAYSADYNGVIIQWDVSSGTPVKQFLSPSGLIRHLALSPDGKRLATAGGFFDRVIRVWDVGSGEIVQQLEGHTEQLESLVYSPDGTRIASGAREGELFLWDAATGELIRRFEGHDDDVNDLAFSPDGRMLASGGSDFGVILWDVETGSEIQRIETGVVYAVAFSPDSKTVVSGTGASSNSVLTLWDVDTGAEIRRYIGHSAPIYSIFFSPDGRMILSGSADRTLRLWYANSGAEMLRVRRSEGVESVAVSADGQQALSGARDGSIVLTDLTTGEEIRRYVGHDDVIRTVAFTPDESKALSASLDGTIRVWDAASGDEIRRFEEHADQVLSLDVSPDGRRALSTGFIAAGSDLAGEVILWDIDTGETVWRVNQAGLNAVFSPDGQTVLVSIADFEHNLVEVWDTASGETLNTFEFAADPIWGLDVSPDGKLALIGMADSTVRLWDIDSAQEVRRFIGHTDLVNSVAFAPDGKSALSASSDGTIILWDVATGAEIHRLIGHTGLVRSVVVSDDGTVALSGSRDGTLRLWRLFTSTDALIEWVQANRYLRELTCSERLQHHIEPLCATEATAEAAS